MRILSSRRGRWGLIVAAMAVLLIGVFYFSQHPRLSPDIVKIECQWFFHHRSLPNTAATDPRQIEQITGVIKKGRPTAHPLSKLIPVAVIRITDAGDQEKAWTLYQGGTIGEWGTGWHYQVGIELESLLKDTLPPPTVTTNE